MLLWSKHIEHSIILGHNKKLLTLHLPLFQLSLQVGAPMVCSPLIPDAPPLTWDWAVALQLLPVLATPYMYFLSSSPVCGAIKLLPSPLPSTLAHLQLVRAQPGHPGRSCCRSGVVTGKGSSPIPRGVSSHPAVGRWGWNDARQALAEWTRKWEEFSCSSQKKHSSVMWV